MRTKEALPKFWLLILWTMLSLCTQDSNNTLSPDTEVPSIETGSPDTIVVTQGDTLPVPEVQAYDNIEGDITEKISIDSSEIDLEALGSYDLFFTVSDNSGNTDTLQLCVLVTDGSVSPERLQGKWLLSERYHDFQGDTYTSEESWEYNRSFDKLLYSNFMRISNDSIYHYVKDTSGISSFFSTFSISGKSLYLTTPKNRYPHDTVDIYMKEGKVFIEDTILYTDGTLFTQKGYVEFTEDIPPDIWFTGPEADEYEDDDSLTTANPMEPGDESGPHSITKWDYDIFEFKGDSGTNYLVTTDTKSMTYGFFTAIYNASSQLINYSFYYDESRYGLGVEKGVECALVFECKNSAEYYIFVGAYRPEADGYYILNLDTTSLSGTTPPG